MRLFISGGGTGGHVYPALAVAEALSSEFRVPSSEFLYVGSAAGVEREIVAKEGLPFYHIAAGGLRGLPPWKLLPNLVRLVVGLGQAWRLVRALKPDVILATGGYVCAPVVVAGWLRRVPTLVYLPDIEPGWAIKFLARFATKIAVSFAESSRYFPAHKVIVTGYPVRPELLKVDKALARQRLGLEDKTKTLLVCGGSQGAHSINLAISRIVATLLERCQIVHICGPQDEGWLRSQREGLPRRLQSRYNIYPYLHQEMADALAVADLAVARAGAATMGEFPALGLPSILIPYPYAGRHQKLNAEYMARSGAAVVVDNAELGEKLLPTVQRLLADEGLLSQMGKRAHKLSRPQATGHLAEELLILGRNDQ